MKLRVEKSPFLFARNIAFVFGLLAHMHQPASAKITVEVNFDNGDLSIGSVAALVADTAQDGFLMLDDPTVPGTILSSGQFIGTSDDRIIAVFEADGGDHWSGVAGIADLIERIDYDDYNLEAGTPLILYIFPDATQIGDVVSLEDRIIHYRNTEVGASGGDMAFEVPADGGAYILSALTSGNGGSFDPSNPDLSESYGMATAGGDDHGNTQATSTLLTSGGNAVPGILGVGDVDYFRFTTTGPSRIYIHTTGGTNTVGSLYDDQGSMVNDPVDDDDAGDGSNFRIEETVIKAGTFFIAVESNGGGQFDLVYEIIPFIDRRPDATIGKSFNRQKGNDFYNRSGAKQKLSLVTTGRKMLDYCFTIQNDGELVDTIKMAGSKRNRKFDAKYMKLTGGRINVTGAFNLGKYTSDFQSRGLIQFKLTAKPTHLLSRSRRSASRTFSISARSGELLDRVKATAKKK